MNWSRDIKLKWNQITFTEHSDKSIKKTNEEETLANALLKKKYVLYKNF